MTKVSLGDLKAIALAVEGALLRLPTKNLIELLNDSDMYHGLQKLTLPKDFLMRVFGAKHYLKDISTDNVQVELVNVTHDLSEEVHYHEESDAVVMCPRYYRHSGYFNSLGGLRFLHGRWMPFVHGEVFEIPAGTRHGFSVHEGGYLHFISVQSPPLVRDGRDDYHKD